MGIHFLHPIHMEKEKKMITVNFIIERRRKDEERKGREWKRERGRECERECERERERERERVCERKLVGEGG